MIEKCVDVLRFVVDENSKVDGQVANTRNPSTFSRKLLWGFDYSSSVQRIYKA